MTKGLLKVVDCVTALLVLGPIAAMLMASLNAADGDPYSTPLTSSTPAKGALFLVAILLMAAAAAVLWSRLITRGRGLCMAGLILGWASFATANVRQALGDTDAANNLTPLILEAVIILPWAAVLAILVEALSPVTAEELGHPGGTDLPAPGLAGVRHFLTPKNLLPSLVAGVVAGGILAFIAAITPYKGQALFAACLAGLAAGWASTYAYASSHQDRHPSLIPAVLALPVLALLSALYLKLGVGSQIVEQVRASSGSSGLFAIGRILPLDWVAGGLFGVPIGANWAASMVERQHHARDHAAHSA